MQSASTNSHVAIAAVPAGAWAVAVSGGADSIALLRLAATRNDLQLVVVHIDHELRGDESDADARFVARLAESLDLPCECPRRSEIERRHPPTVANPSARYRAARHAAFAEAIDRHRLAGVLLAHHRDDQAETVLQRLVRGAPLTAMAGMAAETRLRGVKILRPLLGIGRATLRTYLADLDQPHREDASNASPRQQRNRVRAYLAGRPAVTESLLQLGDACATWRDWLLDHRPTLADAFDPAALGDLPVPVAQMAAAKWLIDQGVPPGEAARSSVQLIELTNDAARGPVTFPGGVIACRRGGRIEARRTVFRKTAASGRPV